MRDIETIDAELRLLLAISPDSQRGRGPAAEDRVDPTRPASRQRAIENRDFRKTAVLSAK
jgi:hypothetical protein